MAETSLDELKKQYEWLRQRYKLPSFSEMNQDFEIEKLQEKETEILSREIRRAMIEKSLAYLRFVEMFMNPSSAPIFFFAMVKGLDTEEKKLLEELYSELGKYEVISLALDNEYNEEKELKFIKDFYNKWQEIKKKFSRILKSVEKDWEKKGEKKDKCYLG
ncbi:MAG: hypothetical protein AABX71_00765 [Nanoarchaeota archaeon]